MSRKEQPPATIAAAMSDATTDLIRADEAELRQIDENAVKLADRIGYDGPLSLGGAEDHARMQMRRTVNECLELGKTLLIIRELTPHGGFKDRVDLLGIDYTAAKRFMQATLKFSKGASTHLLAAAGSQTKLLELLVLDDGEIKELSENGSVRGVSIDEIDGMTAKELRQALRKSHDDAKSDAYAKDKLIQTQSENLQKLHKQLAEAERRQTAFTDEEKRDYECAPLHDTINDAMLALGRMAKEVGHLVDNVGGELVTEECFHAVLLPIKRALEIANYNRLHIDLQTLFDDQHDGALDGLEMRAAGLNPEALQ